MFKKIFIIFFTFATPYMCNASNRNYDSQFTSEENINPYSYDIDKSRSDFSYSDLWQEGTISKTFKRLKKEHLESVTFTVITFLKLLLLLILFLVYIFYIRKQKRATKLMALICLVLVIVSIINWLVILLSSMSNDQKLFFELKDMLIMFLAYSTGITAGELIIRYKINSEKVP